VSYLAFLRSRLETRTPDLTADLRLLSGSEGGREAPIHFGWCFPCQGDDSDESWSGYPLLEYEMAPGDTRRVGFVFLMGSQAADALRKARTFRLWEKRVIGVANVLPQDEREITAATKLT
jgi:hypothetical protein